MSKRHARGGVLREFVDTLEEKKLVLVIFVD
jgi:hypothetical protein